MEKFVERLIEEREELVEKMEKLAAFADANWDDISETEAYLFHEQMEAMLKYGKILNARIELYVKHS